MGNCENYGNENCESTNANKEDVNLYHWYGSPIIPNVSVGACVLIVVVVGFLIMKSCSM